MEKHMAQTLTEIDSRIPDALRVAFGICRPRRPAILRGQQDEAANFAAVLLAPRDANDDDGASDAMDCDDDEAQQPEGDLGMVFASSYIKDHDEDAHFGHAEAGVIGVADGVGGYRSNAGGGVDASAFSRALMHNAYAEVAATTAVHGARFCPRALLELAYQMTAAACTPAASTAAIVSLAGRTLKWAFVGDSGFVVLRGGRILRRFRPQQHYFNCPYQLSSNQESDRLADADVGEVAAKEGDIVVLGTDGLFDNVFDAEIERIVRMGTALGFAPKNMAEVMAAFAFEAATCRDRDTPYSSACRTQPGRKPFIGGKPDDITVVVAYIVSCPIRSQI
ncbi:hypothetical protein BDA96_04G238800 [Sorghum bicolor]|uniref:Protein phosphatase n=2 Tax=Sorghum bicolor TaxID=4558 RepID=A0A921R680_SORBI|nr:putative protein phosphatase 2C 24 [Sorghum bicolor]KAG0533974.1 hypothetical protein BDA96_04G238800 [Sorghum bicolor]OQU85364.1 hypothetical protein SORBI_3004G224350 [Sorghum bicolor]|eukprot:XP_021315248.1 putative protein phosphatase 2C 24 [Sorghum bicolor]